ncbi:MAG TPA: FAD-binding protein [Limnochordales bacterium]
MAKEIQLGPNGARALVTDVLIIGGSVAALRAALAAREKGAAVLIACRGRVGRGGNAAVSSGGIGAAMSPADEAVLAEDMFRAGCGINDPALVSRFVAESSRRVFELRRYGVDFATTADGQLDKVRVPGHSAARSLRAVHGETRNSGLALTVPLAEAAQAAGAEVLEYASAVQLLVDEGRVVGCLVHRRDGDELLPIFARATILATGGGAYLWRQTNGTSDVMGDGIGMGLLAGALARDLEFVQFHPTRSVTPVEVLISDSLTGDGAVLRNRHGERFMARYHPDGDRAPRTTRSCAIIAEIQQGNGVEGGVYLDASAVPPDRINARYSRLQRLFQARGVRFPEEWIIVKPAAHFFMGGLVIDAYARTTVPGLLAAGECTGGLHGADRLGSMALAEAVVFGAIAGETAVEEMAMETPAVRDGWWAAANGAALQERAAAALSELAAELRQRVDLDLAPLRNGEALGALDAWLRSADGRLQELLSEPLPAGERARALGLRSSIAAAWAIARAAAHRTESRGSHQRAEYPETKPEWEGSLFVGMSAGIPEPRFVPKGGGSGAQAAPVDASNR